MFICPYTQGDLATVHSAEHNEWLSALTDGSRTWLGGMRTGAGRFDNSQWIWVDETEFDYTNWQKRQPNNYRRNQYCLEMNFGPPGKWNDDNCNAQVGHNSYICEDNSISKWQLYCTLQK